MIEEEARYIRCFLKKDAWKPLAKTMNESKGTVQNEDGYSAISMALRNFLKTLFFSSLLGKKLEVNKNKKQQREP